MFNQLRTGAKIGKGVLAEILLVAFLGVGTVESLLMGAAMVCYERWDYGTRAGVAGTDKRAREQNYPGFCRGWRFA